jgi:hypothetical protein
MTAVIITTHGDGSTWLTIVIIAFIILSPFLVGGLWRGIDRRRSRDDDTR